MSQTIHEGDCLEVMRGMADASVDAVVTDPPYPCIKRTYGYWTEEQWWALMRPVVAEVRRLLKPTGSAVFILQSNQEHVGRERPWLWEFMAWVAREWNMVMPLWWWNHAAQPGIHAQRKYGLCRRGLHAIIWAGNPDCHRNQEAVLWEPSDAMKLVGLEDRSLHRTPSGWSVRPGCCAEAVAERGGVTPFDVIPMANTNSSTSSGAHGHGAGKPVALAEWLLRYLCPVGGTVLDPFLGSGTTLVAAARLGFNGVGIERGAEYVAIARARVAHAEGRVGLFADEPGEE